MKKIVLLLSGLLLIVGLLWWADFAKVYQSLQQLDITAIGLVCLLQLVTILMINMQWLQIGKKIKSDTSFGEILHVNMVGTFVESITPAAKAGGELTKVVLLKTRLGFASGEALALVGLQKSVSMIAFLILNLVFFGWLLLRFELDGAYQQMLGGSFAILFLFTVIVLGGLVYPHHMARLVSKLPINSKWREKLQEQTSKLSNAVKKVAAELSFIGWQLGLSVAIWSLFVFKTYILAVSLEIDIGLLSIGVVTYLTYLVGMIPLTPGGVGTFEGSMVFLLAIFGVASAPALALALAVRFITFWFVFLCSALYMGVIEVKEF